jgi:hypothetical protein
VQDKKSYTLIKPNRSPEQSDPIRDADTDDSDTPLESPKKQIQIIPKFSNDRRPESKAKSDSEEESSIAAVAEPISPKKVIIQLKFINHNLKKIKQTTINLVSPQLSWFNSKKRKKEENSTGVSPYFPSLAEEPTKESTKEKKQTKLLFQNEKSKKKNGKKNSKKFLKYSV